MARANPDRQKEMAKKLEQGKFSIRDWREQLSNMMSMCVSNVLSFWKSAHEALGDQFQR